MVVMGRGRQERVERKKREKTLLNTYFPSLALPMFVEVYGE